MDQTTLYVDVENLQMVAKQAILAALENWPLDFPRPDAVKLYVRADQTKLWRIRAGHHLPSIQVHVDGVQHYTLMGSKNSADICLSLDALADLLKGKTKYVAILSDDSDFASLFTSIKQETELVGSKVPFKWFMTDRADTVSQMLTEFFPADYIHMIHTPPPPNSSQNTIVKPLRTPRKRPVSPSTIPTTLPSQPVNPAVSVEREIAKTIVQDIKVGPFKSSDCRKIIAKKFPNHPLGQADSAAFGTQFAKLIWPILQEWGAQLPNPNRKPRKYEMTEVAKQKVGAA